MSNNSSEIKLEYYPYIHNLINYMRRNRDIKLTIIGHSDRFGSQESNKEISYKRARVIMEYMTKFGLDKSRFAAVGLGNRHPAVYSGKKKFSDFNRRVEFRIVREAETSEE